MLKLNSVHPPLNMSSYIFYYFFLYYGSAFLYIVKNFIHVGVGKYGKDVFSLYDDVFVCVSRSILFRVD